MMTYFEVKDRLENIKQFRSLYNEYLDFTNRETNLPAQMVRSKMEPMMIQTVDSLQRVKLGKVITRDAPTRGGKRVKINVIRAIFRDRIIKHFSLDEKEPLEVLDQGINIYQKLLWKQRLQLFNPLFWLYHFAGFVAELPFHILEKSGYDTKPVQKLGLTRLYKLIVQVLIFYIVFDLVGLIDWIRFDILP